MNERADNWNTQVKERVTFSPVNQHDHHKCTGKLWIINAILKKYLVLKRVCLLHLHHFRDISATRGNRCLPSCVRVYFNKWLLSKRWCQLFRPSVSHSPVAIKERLWDWNGSTALRFVPFVCHLVFLKDLRVCKEKARRDVFCLGRICMISIYFELTVEIGPHEAFTDPSLTDLYLNGSLFVSWSWGLDEAISISVFPFQLWDVVSLVRQTKLNIQLFNLELNMLLFFFK